MYKCCVCGESTYNIKVCYLSERSIPVCERCEDEAPLDTPDGFSYFCADKIFKGEHDMNSVLSRYKNVKDSILSFFKLEEKELRNNIELDLDSMTVQNNKINSYYEPMYHMSVIPPVEFQKGEVDPLIYKVYKSPINKSYWCASGYNKNTMTFSGMVLGIDIKGTSFDVDELYSYMVEDYKVYDLPMRLSDLEEKLNMWR